MQIITITIIIRLYYIIIDLASLFLLDIESQR